MRSAVVVPGISAGEAHTCAVVDGAVRCWGNGVHRQTGKGTERNDGYLVLPDGLQSSVRNGEMGTPNRQDSLVPFEIPNC